MDKIQGLKENPYMHYLSPFHRPQYSSSRSNYPAASCHIRQISTARRVAGLRNLASHPG